MRLHYAAALLLAALSSAAGPYSGRLSDDDLDRIRTIGIVSDIGHSFVFEQVRERRAEWFGPPDSHFLETSDWGLDAHANELARTALGPRLTVKPVAFVPADFSSWDYALLKHATLDLNADPAIDAYVLILRDVCGDAIGHSVHALEGLGLYRRGTKLGLFACYRIVVVDALTGDTLASRAAGTQGLPWLPVAFWPRTPNDLTAPQSAALAGLETKLIDATLPPALAGLGLAPQQAADRR